MKYGHKLPSCSLVMLSNNSQKIVFAEYYDVTVTLHFDLWLPNSNPLILESNWTFVPNEMKFPEGDPEISHSLKWNGRTDRWTGNLTMLIADASAEI